MKQRLMKLTIALLIPMAILAALMSIVTAARATAPDDANTTRPVQFTLDPAKDPLPSIVARRFTSIPFGIDPYLPLSHNRRSVEVSGPGECPTGGEYFRIRVTVTQNGQQVRALGATTDDCANLPGWSAVATTPGVQTLTPGPAEACGHVIVYGAPKGARVGKWCKNVTLE